MLLAKLVAGLCALFLGRRLFWLFVGVVGFALGTEVATRLFAGVPELILVIIAVVAGISGALLATAMQELMVGIAGFVTGSYLGGLLLAILMPDPGQAIWLAMLVGGIVGAVLFSGLFDWALIVLSSVVGAGLIVQAGRIGPEAMTLAYFVLVVIGIAAQASWVRRRRRLLRMPARARRIRV